MLALDRSTWVRVAFGDVVSNVNTNVRGPASTGIERVIAMEHLSPGELEIRRWASIGEGTTFTRRVTPGQTLFGKRRAYQRKVAYAEFDAICSGDILTFEADDAQLLPQLLPFLVQSDGFFEHALGTSAGSLSPRTNWRDLADFEFNLPPLKEQERLAALLWAVERNRRSHEGMLEQLVETEACWIRLVESSSSSRCALGQVLETILDRRGITPKKLGGAFTPDGVPVLSAMNIVEGSIDRSRQERFVSEEVAERWMTGWLLAGDILMTSEAPLGSTVLLEEDLRACIGQRLFALRADQRRVLPEYLNAWLSSALGQSALRQRASGTTVKGIRQSELVKVELPIPELPAQQDFVGKWIALKAASYEIVRQLTATRQLRKSLIGQVFGGS